MIRRSLIGAAAVAMALACAAPASATPSAGQFCGKTDHGKTLSGLTCAQDADGKHWRWQEAQEVQAPDAARTSTPAADPVVDKEPTFTG